MELRQRFPLIAGFSVMNTEPACSILMSLRDLARISQSSRLIASIVAFAAAIAVSTLAVAQTSLIVNRTTDDGSGSVGGSLSWAINQFNSLNVSNTTLTITFALTGGGNTITLNGGMLPPL